MKCATSKILIEIGQLFQWNNTNKLPTLTVASLDNVQDDNLSFLQMLGCA